jgi:hypothetical protein
MTEPDWLAEGFEQNRARLRAVAYRMLGSRAEAENAVCSVMPTAASWTLEADVAARALAGPPGEAGGALIVVGALMALASAADAERWIRSAPAGQLPFASSPPSVSASAGYVLISSSRERLAGGHLPVPKLGLITLSGFVAGARPAGSGGPGRTRRPRCSWKAK